MTYGIAGLILIGSLKKDNSKIVKRIIISAIVCMIYLPALWGVLLLGNGDYGLATEITGNETFLNSLAGQIIAIPIVPLFNHIFFPIIPSVYMGIWLGNMNVMIKPELHMKTLKKLTLIGLAVSVAGAIPLVLINDVWFPGLFTAGIVYSIHMISGLAAGVGYAALFGVLGMYLKYSGIIVKSITAMGRRSLTFFVVHEILIVLLMSPVALDLGARLNVTTAFLSGVGIWVVTLVAAYFMEKNEVNGPLETAMRHLTYKNLEKQPLSNR